MRQQIASWLIEWIERGWMPDVMTRRLARGLCRRRLQELVRENQRAWNRGVSHFAQSMREGPVAPVPEKANEQHYEVPAEFFELILGRQLKYSCCYFSSVDSTLEQAERDSLQLTCQHAEISDGLDVLELGCGWGSLTLWMLEHFPNLRITAVSNSHSQREFILQRASVLGVSDRLQVVTADMNDFDTDHRFDRVVSCEMFEHMRNYELLLRRITCWLRPGGKLFVHIFCHKNFAYAFQSDGATNWMGRYFFTGGIMPSLDLLDEFQECLRVTDRWTWSGIHYERTCNAWLRRLDQHREPALEVLAETYGDEANRWLQRWRLFLIAGAELFGFERGQQWMIGHFLMEHTGTLSCTDNLTPPAVQELTPVNEP